jgi:CheY-like chemotaxis protein
VTEKKKILVIDDEPDFVKFLTVLLEDNGYSTISAENGLEGLKKAQTEHPDLILLDITMPEMSGVKFYREIRGDLALKAVPVVLVTGVADDFEKFIHTRRQVPPPDGYIRKPLDKEKLLATISQLLSSD